MVASFSHVTNLLFYLFSVLVCLSGKFKYKESYLIDYVPRNHQGHIFGICLFCATNSKTSFDFEKTNLV